MYNIVNTIQVFHPVLVLLSILPNEYIKFKAGNILRIKKDELSAMFKLLKLLLKMDFVINKLQI